jgi:hypothetical protein
MVLGHTQVCTKSQYYNCMQSKGVDRVPCNYVARDVWKTADLSRHKPVYSCGFEQLVAEMPCRHVPKSRTNPLMWTCEPPNGAKEPVSLATTPIPCCLQPACSLICFLFIDQGVALFSSQTYPSELLPCPHPPSTLHCSHSLPILTFLFKPEHR